MVQYTYLSGGWKNSMIMLLVSTCFCEAAPDTWEESAVRSNMEKVARWQIDNPKKHKKTDWTYGAFAAGLAQYGLSVPEGKALDTLRTWGRETDWGLGPTPPALYHADNHCIGSAWIELAMADGNPEAAAGIRSTLDRIIENPPKTKLQFGTPGCSSRWCWSDALFMAPPVYVQMSGYTGDEKYLRRMDAEYKATVDYLYDREAGLFFRDSRYFNQKAANGEKMFWSRGNGWVMAGLPRMLRDMPADWPTRPYYENLFRELASALKKCQADDGTWHSCLLDPGDPPLKEMSGTLYIAYGLMWGVNNGLLEPAEYLPVIRKAWSAACGAVDDRGKLGWVQPIADKPGHYGAEDSEVYGAGAYLLTGAELRKYLIGESCRKLGTVHVGNPSARFRRQETVSVPWTLPAGMSEASLRVFDVRNGCVVPHQLYDANGDGQADTLLFQGNFLANVKRDFWILDAANLPAASPAVVCASRTVPERMDDMAWENDVTAHRIYGPGVAKPRPAGEGLVSSGTDVWSKKGPGLVMDMFYQNGDYHRNHGRGLDMYNVGTGRGCGGTAVFHDGRACTSGNWAEVRHRCNGPVRTAFEVTYQPWKAGNRTVSEQRVYTLDAGSPFTCVRSTFRVEGSDSIPVGVGIGFDPTLNAVERVSISPPTGCVTVWGKPKGDDGRVGTAIVFPGAKRSSSDGKSAYLIADVRDGEEIVWYLGAVWDQASPVRSAGEWEDRTADFAASAKEPLRVQFRKAGEEQGK